MVKKTKHLLALLAAVGLLSVGFGCEAVDNAEDDIDEETRISEEIDQEL